MELKAHIQDQDNQISIAKEKASQAEQNVMRLEYRVKELI